MERGQTRPAPGVLRSRPGRRSLGLVERGGGRQGSRLRFGQGRESEREGEGRGGPPLSFGHFPLVSYVVGRGQPIKPPPILGSRLRGNDVGVRRFAGRVRGNDVCALG